MQKSIIAIVEINEPYIYKSYERPIILGPPLSLQLQSRTSFNISHVITYQGDEAEEGSVREERD